jgi:uncharacterized RmlC-like cupin family protein
MGKEILLGKSHILIGNALDAVVAAGNFMGVPRYIFHHRFRTSKRLHSKN